MASLTGTLQQERHLQGHYFSSPDQCNELLTAFSDRLREQDVATTLVRTTKGVTGYTFLCSVPVRASEGEKPLVPIRFVLKWQNASQNAVERLGSSFFRALGYEAPQIFAPDAQLAAGLLRQVAVAPVPVTQRAVNLQRELDLIAMPQVHANNLREAVLNGKLRRLPVADCERVARIFGQVVAIDVAMSNSDRLLQFTDNMKRPWGDGDGGMLGLRNFCNAGNIMLHFRGGPDGPQSLLSVHPIDNCPSSEIVSEPAAKPQRPAAAAVADELDVFAFLGDAPSDEPAMAVTPAFSSVHQMAPYDPFEEKISGYHEVAMHILRAPEVIAEHLLRNLRQEFLTHDGDSYRQHRYDTFLGAISAHAAAGVREAIERLKVFDTEGWKASLDETLIQTGASQRTLRLLTRNLTAIKESL